MVRIHSRDGPGTETLNVKGVSCVTPSCLGVTLSLDLVINIRMPHTVGRCCKVPIHVMVRRSANCLEPVQKNASHSDKDFDGLLTCGEDRETVTE